MVDSFLRKAALIVLCLPLLAAAAEPAAGQASRIDKLEHTLLAPCCWSETVATHRSEVALRMKVEIRRMVLEGKSDREILDFYKQRYGQRVLVEPEGTQWWVVNIVPVTAVILGLAFTVWVLRRWLRPLPSS